MIYDSKKHAICENWGTVIATFQKEVLAKTAFEIVDKINKCAKLEAQLKDIEEYGTEEINAAYDLRRELVELRVKYDQLYSDTEGK